MIAKKSKRFDLERKRAFFFQAGLLIVGSLVLAAFTYSVPKESPKTIKFAEAFNIEYDIQDAEIIPEPEIEVVELPVIENQMSDATMTDAIDAGLIDENSRTIENNKTKPDSKINTDLPFFDQGIIKIEADNTIHPFVKVEAAYIGGYALMMQFIQSKVVYPEIAREMGVQGKVLVSFVVEKNGDVSNVEIKRGVDKDLDREAIRVVKSFPKWKPGEQNYGAVRTRVVLPINFELK